MKAELRHLLDKLKAEREGFQALTIYTTGSASAVFRFGAIQFRSLEEMEEWAYATEPAEKSEQEQTEGTKA